MPWTFTATYPGVSRAYSFRYTTSLGISPGVFEIECPFSDTAALGGSVFFQITDGTTTRNWTHLNCRLMDSAESFNGESWGQKLTIYDRRWAWADRFQVDGHFNQQDDHRKLIPRSIRSPFQLAVMLLTQMGEPVPSGGWHAPGVIDLPGGLALPASVPLGIPAPHPTLDVLADASEDFLLSGTDFTRSQANPITVWDATPAAVALAELCDTYGRAVVLSPRDNKVRIYKLSVGTVPPGGRLLSDSSAVAYDTVPSAVIARGSPTLYQIRGRFRAVGKDWDGSWKPLSRLSYAPKMPDVGRPMKCTADILASTYSAGKTYVLVVNRVRFTAAPGTHVSAAGALTHIRGLVNASLDPRIVGKVSMSGSVLTGAVNGEDFALRAEPAEDWELDCTEGPLRDAEPQFEEWYAQVYEPVFGAFTLTDTVTLTVNPGAYSFTSTVGKTLDAALAQVAEDARGFCANATASSIGNTLHVCALVAGAALTVTVNTSSANTVIRLQKSREATPAVYGFRLAGHLSTPRANPFLNFRESVNAIRDGVFRYYQLICEDPADPDKKSITVPIIGEVDNRHLLMISPERVEQVTPQPGDTLAIDGRTGQPFAEDTYSGYSSNRKAAVFASICSACWGSINYRVPGGLGPNTPESQQVYIPFEVVDPLRQVVKFSKPIYNVYGKGEYAVYLSSEPIIEMGVNVLDTATLVARRYSFTVPVVGGTAPPVVRTFDDVQAERIAHYDDDHNYTGFHKLDADPEYRAELYATEMASRYQTVGSRTLVYNNLEDIDMDGLVRQVEFAFDKGGASTTCSLNSEFSRRILPYGERRRLENLPPDAQRAAENMAWGRQNAGGHAAANAADRRKGNGGGPG